MDVPITITMRPGVTTVAAGTALCASMMAAATAVPARKPSRDAISLGEAPDLPSGRHDLSRQLVGQGSQRGMERGKEVRARKAALAAPQSFVAGRARVADERAAQLGGHPVAGFDEAEGRIVDGGVFFEDLQDLGAEPFRRSPPAVVGEERLAALPCHRVDAIRLRLRGMVLPQLHPGMGPRGHLGAQAQRPRVAIDRQDRARREVDADADHARGLDRGSPNGAAHRFAHRFEVITWMLQRPLGPKPCAGARQGPLDHPVAIRRDRGAALCSGLRFDDDGTDRRGAEVEPQRTRAGAHCNSRG